MNLCQLVWYMSHRLSALGASNAQINVIIHVAKCQKFIVKDREIKCQLNVNKMQSVQSYFKEKNKFIETMQVCLNNLQFLTQKKKKERKKNASATSTERSRPLVFTVATTCTAFSIQYTTTGVLDWPDNSRPLTPYYRWPEGCCHSNVGFH